MSFSELAVGEPPPIIHERWYIDNTPRPCLIESSAVHCVTRRRLRHSNVNDVQQKKLVLPQRFNAHETFTSNNVVRRLYIYIVALVYNYSNSLLVNFTGDIKNVIKDLKTHIFVRKFDTWLPLTIDIDLYWHF